MPHLVAALVLALGLLSPARADAYMLCSLAADLRVTQLVNGHNGVHVMLEKRYLA